MRVRLVDVARDGNRVGDDVGEYAGCPKCSGANEENGRNGESGPSGLRGLSDGRLGVTRGHGPKGGH